MDDDDGDDDDDYVEEVDYQMDEIIKVLMAIDYFVLSLYLLQHAYWEYLYLKLDYMYLLMMWLVELLNEHEYYYLLLLLLLDV
jgi:hypothetical protein